MFKGDWELGGEYNCDLPLGVTVLVTREGEREY